MQRNRDDKGAVAVLVAILLSTALLGIGAIVVDVGGWYAEKAQLQNGADSAAMAIAQTCAAGACDTSLANDDANVNSNDSASDVDFVCGTGPGLSCSTRGLCPTAPSGNYVNVQTSTRTSSGNLLPPAFGPGQTIHACSQATWGPPASLGSAAALTISACEWLENTNNGTTFAKSPPTPPSFFDTLAARKAAGINFTNANDPNKETVLDDPPGPGAAVAGSETVLTTHSLGKNPCAAGHPGWDEPGKFGWLAKKGDPCTVNIVNGQYDGSPGNAPADCNTLFNQSRDTQTPLFLPVYTSIDPVTGKYILDGFAAFVVTGWDINQASVFSPVKAKSVISVADGVTPANDANYCGSTYTGSNSDVCIYGYFTQALIKQSDVPGGGTGGNDLGATAPYLTG